MRPSSWLSHQSQEVSTPNANRAIVVEVVDLDGLCFVVEGPSLEALSKEVGLHKFITGDGKGGKKHTSFCKVEFMEMAEENLISLKLSDVEFKTQKASGPGGQHVNKTESAVRAKHLPTGLSVLCSRGRCQFENKRTALAMLSSKIEQASKKSQADRSASSWKAGTRAGAGEAAVVYNFPGNFCIFHGERMALKKRLSGQF